MTSPLVTTQWLADHLNNVRVIDIRGKVLPASEPPPHYFVGRDDYAASHIPGAVFVDWTTDITDGASSTGMHIAPPEQFAALMSRLGVVSDTTVVAYDMSNGMFAARLWWALRYYGHENVYVLDGGWAKWVDEGRPVTTDLPEITPTTFTPTSQPALYRNADRVRDALNTDTVLLDVRSPKEYNGEASRIERAGRIPGALNLPRKTLLTAGQTLRAPSEIVADLAAMGIEPEDEVVTYCNSGVSASYVLLALTAAGYTNAAIYDGSWKDWGGNTENPIE